MGGKLPHLGRQWWSNIFFAMTKSPGQRDPCISAVSSAEQTHMVGGGEMPASENDHPFLMAGTSPEERRTRTPGGGARRGWG